MMRIIKDITDFIFVKDSPRSADIIFLPGSTDRAVADLGAELYLADYAPIVMPSGKYSKGLSSFHGSFETESDFYKSILVEHGVPENAIICERQAEFTMQNGLYSRALCDKCGISVHKAIIACKSFHARRCLMYYTFAFPEVEFYICPTDVEGIRAEDWYKEKRTFDVVMGEVEKVGGQLKEDFWKVVR